MDSPHILILINNEEIGERIARALWQELKGRVSYGWIEGNLPSPYDSTPSVSFTWKTPITGLNAVIYAYHQNEKVQEGLAGFAEKILGDFYHDEAWQGLHRRFGVGHTLSQ